MFLSSRSNIPIFIEEIEKLVERSSDFFNLRRWNPIPDQTLCTDLFVDEIVEVPRVNQEIDASVSAMDKLYQIHQENPTLYEQFIEMQQHHLKNKEEELKNERKRIEVEIKKAEIQLQLNNDDNAQGLSYTYYIHNILFTFYIWIYQI